ncbi:MAG: TonB-dependent receptor, partial [Gammaproteobacteria bacterium]|nr:TonB-dependent receptor [Gammaproteobacteria bacterium]
GIGGNRVAIEVDFSPSTDQFLIGAFANSSRSLPEIDLIKEVEILNGPASTFYGSDAIGGVISVVTWAPEDLVKLTDSDSFYKLRLGYDGKNSSQVLSATSAWQNDNIGALLSYTRREGHEINNDGFITAEKDELDWQSDAIFAKFTHRDDNDNQLTLTLESKQKETLSDNNSLLGVGRQFATTTQLLGDDSFDSERLSLEYQLLSDTSLFSVNTFRAHYINGETSQRSQDFRSSRGTPVRQDRAFLFDQKIFSLEYNGLAEFAAHKIVAGVEYSQSDIAELRDALQENLSTGAITTSLLSEQFPLRDFPKSKTKEIGVFIQDEFALDADWTLVPALRIDRFEMTPSIDDVFLQNLSSPEVVSISETAVSPKLGLLHAVAHGKSLYMQYVHGFRAPSYEDVNIGLEMPMFQIRAIPNPDLESERSDSFEFGYRSFVANNHLNLALYYSRYEDFIESKVNLGPDETGFVIFQSQNINEAEIFGFELNHRTSYTLDNWGESTLSIDASLALSRGNNLITDEPLNSISPAQAVLDIGWLSADETLAADLILTTTKSKSRVDDSDTDFFLTPGYTTLDFLINYRLSSDTDLRFSIFNLGDKQFWNWQDVRNLANDSQLIQSVVRPERSFSVSLATKW